MPWPSAGPTEAIILHPACQDNQISRAKPDLLDLGRQPLPNLQAPVRHQDAAIVVDADRRDLGSGIAVKPAAHGVSAGVLQHLWRWTPVLDAHIAVASWCPAAVQARRGAIMCVPEQVWSV